MGLFRPDVLRMLRAVLGTQKPCRRRSPAWPELKELRTPIKDLSNLDARLNLTDTVEKGFAGLPPSRQVKKRFHHHRAWLQQRFSNCGRPELDSVRHHIISSKIDFFNSIDPKRSFSRPAMARKDERHAARPR